MSDPVLECVPNVSEGRRDDVLERLARAARARPDARLLDLSSDRDHDRTVLTLAGTPDALVAALLGLFEVALAEIDLSARAAGADRGVHPCMGAVDVVPFVPLGGAPMALAVATAERLGREVAERFDLPVYLYEEAARRPERRNLADVRRGGFEGLAARCADPDDPLGRPDLGPDRPHPTAGAVAVGARGFLVAFNAVLASDDLPAAREIARAVRASNPSGRGLPAVKALGVRLASRGRVQVSMNLVDPLRTTPLDALRAVRREAEARGLAVEDCELVGLMPEAVAARCLEQALLLPGFDPGRTIERRLAETEED
jgi:glutamate formiminotransferase